MAPKIRHLTPDGPSLQILLCQSSVPHGPLWAWVVLLLWCQIGLRYGLYLPRHLEMARPQKPITDCFPWPFLALITHSDNTVWSGESQV